MERPKFTPIFSQKSEYCEVSNEVPVKTFIPNQAMDLAELVSRFERGQRLNVHNNFAPGSNFYSASEEQAVREMEEETFVNCPPIDVHDVVDVERLKREHDANKREFISRKKKEAEELKRKSDSDPSHDDARKNPE